MTDGTRTRLRRFFDDAGTIVEYGAEVVQPGAHDEGVLEGVAFAFGEAEGESCIVADCSPRSSEGTIGQRGIAELIRAARIAVRADVPLVLLLEGGAYRDGEAPFYLQGRDLSSVLAEVRERIPVVGVAFGSVRGALALALGLSHVVVATAAATITLAEAGAVAVEASDAPSPLARHGAADAVCADEDEAFSVVRRWLQIIRNPQAEHAAEDRSDDGERLRMLVAGNSRRAIDGRRLTDLLLDRGSSIRLRERLGGAVQTTLGRMGGRSVGIVASHSMVNAAAIDAPAAAKLGDFIEFCDTFRLPVIYLTDVPGLMAGPAAERTAVNRHSIRPYNAQARSRTPHLTVIVRRGFGQGLVVMGGGHHVPGSALKLTWPTGQFGVMGNMGAATIRSTSTSSQASMSADEAHADLVSRGAAGRAVRDFSMDALVEPEDTREQLIRFLTRLPLASQTSESGARR